MCISHEATGYIRAGFNLRGYWRRAHLKPHLKPYWGKPAVRNFRGGAGNRVMANLIGHEAGNGGYGQGEPKATAPVLYSTWVSPPRPQSFVCPVYSTRKNRNVQCQGATPISFYQFFRPLSVFSKEGMVK
jgi:hypothetical protein